MHNVSLLACPFCQGALEEMGKSLVCPNKHSFDIAREGYVNLLRKKLPGDTSEMLVARRAFLERGFYQPLSDVLNELVVTRIQGMKQAVYILDAGCGEGYYLGRLWQMLAGQGAGGKRDSSCLGLDISKDAIRMAARQYPEIDFVVANLKEPLVVRGQVLHFLLNVFAPRNAAEFARVLLTGGWLLV